MTKWSWSDVGAPKDRPPPTPPNVGSSGRKPDDPAPATLAAIAAFKEDLAALRTAVASLQADLRSVVASTAPDDLRLDVAPSTEEWLRGIAARQRQTVGRVAGRILDDIAADDAAAHDGA